MAVKPDINFANDAAQNKLDKHSQELLKKEISNELVVAVVGHVGSGTSQIAKQIGDLFLAAEFQVVHLKARKIITDYSGIEENLEVEKTVSFVETLQDAGDNLRRDSQDNAAVAKGLIVEIRRNRADATGVVLEDGEAVKPDGTKRVYILDSLRHPAEVELLRGVYGDAFILIGVVCYEDKRLARISKKYSDGGHGNARRFMERDAKAPEKYGQRVSDAFHLSDFFIDNSEDRNFEGGEPNKNWTISDDLKRLIQIISHEKIVRPNLSETAMYNAYGAKMRSACLSRQVGASLIDNVGNLISTGANEAPRAGGGVYGEDSSDDHRCFQMDDAKCHNTFEQNLIIHDLLKTLFGDEVKDQEKFNDWSARIKKNTRLGGLLEFSRAVHAEMDALTSAARIGHSTVGTRLFVTTFPCHFCARHIVAAGVDEVQYIEPYPKSHAYHLHGDAITSVAVGWVAPSSKQGDDKKVLFRPFTGVAPRMYRRAFLKNRDLKNSDTGKYEVSSPDWGSAWDIRGAGYLKLEAFLAEKSEENETK